MEFAFLFYREFYDIFIQTKNKKKKLKAEIGVVFHIFSHLNIFYIRKNIKLLQNGRDIDQKIYINIIGILQKWLMFSNKLIMILTC